MMDDDWLLQYSRHIFMPEIDIAGQSKLASASVALIGMGGLGTACAQYLASAGVGTLHLIDHDVVSLSNLQRQILYGMDDLGAHKVVAAKARLVYLNPRVNVQTYFQKFDDILMQTSLSKCDVLIDGSDNFKTRYAMNRASLHYQIPLISGAAIGWQGQLITFKPAQQAPCYQCLYGPDTGKESLTCSENGVAAPLVGVIGTMQAMEALKVILAKGADSHKAPAVSKETVLTQYNGFTGRIKQTIIARDLECAQCNNLSLKFYK